MNYGLCLVILLASSLSSAGASAVVSQKDSSKEHQRQASIQTEAAKQRDHDTEILLSAIQAEQVNIIKLTEAIKHEADTRQKEDPTQNKSLPFLSFLSGLRVQQGLLIVGGLYTFFAAWQLLQIRRQATTLEKIESAFLSINFEPKYFPPPDARYMAVLDYWCENIGRTPASLKEFCADLCFAEGLPDKPTYGRFTTYPDEFVVIGPNGAKSRPGSLSHRMNAAEQLQLNMGLTYTWFFYGYFRYAGLYGPDYVVGFAFRFDRNMGGFALVESPQYTYRRKYKRNQPTGLSKPE